MTTPDSITLLSPAKLNLFLHITGRRADGYHNLQTLMLSIDLVKRNFQVCATDRAGSVLYNRTITRSKLEDC